MHKKGCQKFQNVKSVRSVQGDRDVETQNKSLALCDFTGL